MKKKSVLTPAKKDELYGAMVIHTFQATRGLMPDNICWHRAHKRAKREIDGMIRRKEIVIERG